MTEKSEVSKRRAIPRLAATVSGALAYPLLAEHLAYLELEAHYDDILPLVLQGRASMRRTVGGLSVSQLSEWLMNQPFVTLETVTKLSTELVDGKLLLVLLAFDASRWIEQLRLPHRSYKVLALVLNGAEHLLMDPVRLQPQQHPLVAAGVAADLSFLDDESAASLDWADKMCSETGEGSVYASLVAIGFSEFYNDDDSNGKRRSPWVGHGLPNEVFPLRRRQVPNGVIHQGAWSEDRGYGGWVDQNRKEPSCRIVMAIPPPPPPAAAAPAPPLACAPTVAAPRRSSVLANHRPAGARDLQVNLPPRPLGADLDFFTSMGMFRPPNESSASDASPRSRFSVPTASALASAGLERAAPPPQQYIIPCFKDVGLDMFQVGRLPGNDIVVRGPLRSYGSAEAGQRPQLTGPVGRHACRLLCERLPPFRTWIFAGGFDERGDLVLGDKGVVVPIRREEGEGDEGSEELPLWDAFTSFGVRVRQPNEEHPDEQHWFEVSVLGRCYIHPRPHSHAAAGVRPMPNEVCNNELRDGAIIDVGGGVAFLYRSYKAVAAASGRRVDPEAVISRLNDIKPQCPVLLNDIRMSFVSARERFEKELQRLLHGTNGGSFIKRLNLRVPSTDPSLVGQDGAPYVFPACGHVQGWHKNMVGVPCPLCRKHGPFVPLALALEPAICSGHPTHVFNPCGHAASRSTCARWAGIEMPEPGKSFRSKRDPRCPYCNTMLQAVPALGGPFNKLVFQSEGEWGESDPGGGKIDTDGLGEGEGGARGGGRGGGGGKVGGGRAALPDCTLRFPKVLRNKDGTTVVRC